MDGKGQSGRDGEFENEQRREMISDISPCATASLDIEIRTDSHSRSKQPKNNT